jgi:thiosulfate dehydrogenase (quinone) large subunit
MNALLSPKFTGILWLIARVWLGYDWLTAGIGKVFGEKSVKWVGEDAGAAVTGFLNGAIAKSPLAADYVAGTSPAPTVQVWYAEMVQNYFLPNALLFSYLVAWGELLVGLALILGIFTRFSAFMGVIMNMSFLLAGTLSTNPQMLFVGMFIALAGGIAAGYYGLDYFARPIEARLIKRTRERFFPAPQAV